MCYRVAERTLHFFLSLYSTTTTTRILWKNHHFIDGFIFYHKKCKDGKKLGFNFFLLSSLLCPNGKAYRRAARIGNNQAKEKKNEWKWIFYRFLYLIVYFDSLNSYSTTILHHQIQVNYNSNCHIYFYFVMKSCEGFPFMFWICTSKARHSGVFGFSISCAFSSIFPSHTLVSALCCLPVPVR